MFQEPGPARDYRAFKEARIKPEMQSIDNPMKNLVKWDLEIDNCTENGETATINATEVQYRMPPNAAALNFATIITSKLKVDMKKTGNQWKVMNEELLNKDVSTYDDRR